MRSARFCLCVVILMAVERRWLFTPEELAYSPSRLSGIDADKELNYRQQTANFIQDMGQRLQVTQLCINTAIVYMHRFYVFHSFSKFSRQSMAAACLFLAAKVEEQPRKLEHVIKVAHMCLHRDAPAPDPKSEAYMQQAQDLAVNENILLQTLGFDIQVDHPHTTVVKTCQLVRASKDLAQTSYFLATNSLHLTTMCLQYRPTVVACVCVHLACKWSSWEIPRSSEGKEWFVYTDKDVTLELLEKLTQEFLDVLDKCPSKLKKKIMTWKSGKKDEEPTPGLSASSSTPSGASSAGTPRAPKTEPSATVTSASDQQMKPPGPRPDKPLENRLDRPDKMPGHHPDRTQANPGANALDGMRRVKTEPSLNLSHKDYLERKKREMILQQQHRQDKEKQEKQDRQEKPDRHHLDALMNHQQKERSHRPEGHKHGEHRRPDQKHRSHTDVFHQPRPDRPDGMVKQESGKPHGYDKNRDSHRTQPNLIKKPHERSSSQNREQKEQSTLGLKMEPLPPPEVLMAELTKVETGPEASSQNINKPQGPPLHPPRPKPKLESKQRPPEPLVQPQPQEPPVEPLKSPPLKSPVKANPVVRLEPLVQAVKEGDPLKKKLESGSVDRRLSVNMSQLRERYKSESDKSSPGTPPTPSKSTLNTSSASLANTSLSSNPSNTPHINPVTNSPLKIIVSRNPHMDKEKERRERKESKSERREREREKEKIKLKIKNISGSPNIANLDESSRGSPSDGKLKMRIDLKRKELKSASDTPNSEEGYKLNASLNPLKIKISKSSTSSPAEHHKEHREHKHHHHHKSHKHDKHDRDKSRSNGSSHRKRSHAEHSHHPTKMQRTETPVNGSSTGMPDLNTVMSQLQQVIDSQAASIVQQQGLPPLPHSHLPPPPPLPPK